MPKVQRTPRAHKAARKRRRSRYWFTLPALYAEFPVYKTQKLRSDGDTALGICYTPPDGFKIRIKTAGLTKDQQRAVIWHEAFHAIFHAGGHEGHFDDEALIEMLAIAVMRIRKKVPWL